MNALSIREAAEEFGIDNKTISGWVAQGLVTVEKRPERRGQPMLIRRDDVQRIASTRVPGRGRWNRKVREHLAS
ncbi:MAG: helix-turn-helix domain-containing protein [Dehalococcoidia bacterium]|nr:helix-turn-helix domain-containing protein [Dehalococcoidia bacterium]